MENTIQHYEVVKKLIELTEQLINDIILVARHKDRQEFSMRRAGKEANNFITRLKKLL